MSCKHKYEGADYLYLYMNDITFWDPSALGGIKNIIPYFSHKNIYLQRNIFCGFIDAQKELLIVSKNIEDKYLVNNKAI